MRIRFVAFMVSLVIISVCIAGCSSNAPSEHATTQSKTELSKMALQLGDLPENFVIKERSERITSDVAPAALENGWKKGYGVIFSRVDLNRRVGTEITQDISIYPIEKIAHMLPVLKAGYTQQSGNTSVVEDLSDPDIGDESQAFRITNTYDKSRTYIIIFNKMDVIETVTMTGITTDYETLKELAKKAASNVK